VFVSSRRRHTSCYRDWSSDVCSSDLRLGVSPTPEHAFTPTSSVPHQVFRAVRRRWFPVLRGRRAVLVADAVLGDQALAVTWAERSEERRVGKECGWGCATGGDRTYDS